MKKIISLLLSILFISAVFSPVSFSAGDNEVVIPDTDLPFTDVAEDSWYYSPVKYAYYENLVYGMTPTTFGPDVPLNRAMAVTIIARASGEDVSKYEDCPFADCPIGEYYSQSVAWAAEHGIVSGMSDTVFAPLSPLTREQFAVILCNYADYAGIYMPEGATATLYKYTDRKDVSSWSKTKLISCIVAGILSGTSPVTLSPKAACTRAQTVALLYRAFRQHAPLVKLQDESVILGEMNITEEVTRYVYAGSLTRMTGFGDNIGLHVDEGRFHDIVAGTPWVAFCEIAAGQGFIIPQSENMFGTGTVTVRDAIYGLLVAIGYRDFEGDPVAFAEKTGLLEKYYGTRNGDAPLTFGLFAELADRALDFPTVISVKKDDGQGDRKTEYYKFENKTLRNAYIDKTELSEGPVKITNSGWDIFNPPGYHYGTSMIRNADGTLDFWFAGLAAIRPKTEVDWIIHSKSYDNGASRTVDVGAGKPTFGSEDWHWACDPGVFRLGEYYYLGYSSILWHSGADNNLFISRGRTPDDLCEEKWNGNGWSEHSALPAVSHDEDYNGWGAGEPSFVVIGDTIYCYITWQPGSFGSAPMTRLYTAPADDENWPGKLKYTGYCYPRANNEDSADVKYVDEYGCFIAFSTSDRMTTNSKLTIHVSFDGKTFRTEQLIPQGDKILSQIHNCGVTGDERGHMHLDECNFVSYAYSTDGSRWGSWPNRLAPLALAGSAEYDNPSLSPARESDATTDYTRSAEFTDMVIYVGNTDSCTMYVDKNLTPQKFTVYLKDKYGNQRQATSEEYKKFTYTYRESDMTVDPATRTVTPISNRYASAIKIKYGSAYRSIYVKPVLDSYAPVYLKCESQNLVFGHVGELKRPSIIMGDYAGNTVMLWGNLSSDDVYPKGYSAERAGWPTQVSYFGYDEDIIKIDENMGLITALRSGKTQVYVSAGNLTSYFTVTVN